MARYIDANLLWKALDIAHLFDEGNPRHIAQQVVEEQPTTDVVEVKHGEWVYWQPDGTNHLWRCSVCDGVIITPMKFVVDHIKYCEHCGAKMDGERKCEDGK